MTDELRHNWNVKPKRLTGKLSIRIGERTETAEPGNDDADQPRPAA